MVGVGPEEESINLLPVAHVRLASISYHVKKLDDTLFILCCVICLLNGHDFEQNAFKNIYKPVRCWCGKFKKSY